MEGIFGVNYMKKIYFDIGTNLFQGYHQVSSMLSMNDDWYVVFVEPNPNFIIQKNMDQIAAVKNSKFIPRALCDDPEKMGAQVPFYISRDDNILNSDSRMDQGASIYKNNDNVNEIMVDSISIIDLVADYLDGYEWYFKFDCEGAEFDSLPKLINAYPEKIKHIICEFHELGSPSERKWNDKKDQIMNLIYKYNIQFTGWH